MSTLQATIKPSSEWDDIDRAINALLSPSPEPAPAAKSIRKRVAKAESAQPSVQPPADASPSDAARDAQSIARDTTQRKPGIRLPNRPQPRPQARAKGAIVQEMIFGSKTDEQLWAESIRASADDHTLTVEPLLSLELPLSLDLNFNSCNKLKWSSDGLQLGFLDHANLHILTPSWTFSSAQRRHAQPVRARAPPGVIALRARKASETMLHKGTKRQRTLASDSIQVSLDADHHFHVILPMPDPPREWPASSVDAPPLGCPGTLGHLWVDFAWSPSGIGQLASNAVALLSNNGEVCIYQPLSRSHNAQWTDTCDLTDILLGEHITTSPADAAAQSNSTQSLAWSENTHNPATLETYSLLALGHRAGQLTLWRLGEDARPCLEQRVHIRDSAWITFLSWQAWRVDADLEQSNIKLAWISSDDEVGLLTVTSEQQVSSTPKHIVEIVMLVTLTEVPTSLRWCHDQLAVTMCSVAELIAIANGKTAGATTRQVPLLRNTEGRIHSAFSPCCAAVPSQEKLLIVAVDSGFQQVDLRSASGDVIHNGPTVNVHESATVTRTHRHFFAGLSIFDNTLPRMRARTIGYDVCSGGSLEAWAYKNESIAKMINKTRANPVATLVVLPQATQSFHTLVAHFLEASCATSPLTGASSSAIASPLLAFLKLHVLDDHIMKSLDTVAAQIVDPPLDDRKLPETPAHGIREALWTSLELQRIRCTLLLFTCLQVGGTAIYFERVADFLNTARTVSYRSIIAVLSHLLQHYDAQDDESRAMLRRIQRSAHASDASTERDEGLSCLACSQPLRAEGRWVLQCANGHLWDRCSVTFSAIGFEPARTCCSCGVKSLTPHATDTTIANVLLAASRWCLYCGGQWAY
ncbi:uncharacterized protein L969DRAFT_373124 [Mixia osmundae IAM 14324]|uniref:Transcription factor IIIC putative zinc-finger domain-containing protein n=1 Tax=Mixia osmundae (strain CBS 9802 / IAM 14324 / JCM 22182 / KY 12970) TaxID=764103 RepID=G7DUD1_MIXOS|nr:uncharacterized protein L969DRAFT_373124 [Mixia osmundae IAM 14324]KEI41063.1 hypothetical protein L969DRAFT_373124 [Mixia osmundae IAM 14324]GAA94191.1 hypothetical protein E5Q_00839 [Mixia osmundae IAM 14324]